MSDDKMKEMLDTAQSCFVREDSSIRQDVAVIAIDVDTITDSILTEVTIAIRKNASSKIIMISVPKDRQDKIEQLSSFGFVSDSVGDDAVTMLFKGNTP